MKCSICKKTRTKEELYFPPVGFGCACKPAISQECATALAQKALKKAQAAERKKDREWKAETRRRRKQNESRLDLYDRLGTLVNQYIKHVLRKGDPCFTCGKQQKHGDAPGAFHAGHYMPSKRVDPRRFMHDNIEMQCYSCNCANSGRGAEYKTRMIEKHGAEFVSWLECEANHKPLKEQFAEKSDIENEIAKYRKLIRENGIKPNC